MEYAGVIAELPNDISAGIDIPALGKVAAGDVEGLEITVHDEIAVCKPCGHVVVQTCDDPSIPRRAVVHSRRDVKHRVGAGGVAHKPTHVGHEVGVVTATINIARRAGRSSSSRANGSR